MDMADLYFVARKLRIWVEREVLPPEVAREIPLHQWVILREIIDTPMTTVQELTRRFSLAQSMVSKVVAESKEQGLLLTQVDEHDKRKVHLLPSKKLLKLVQPVMNRDADEVLAPLWEHFSPADQACIKHTFTLLHDHFKRLETGEIPLRKRTL